MLCRLDWLFLHEAMLNFLESSVVFNFFIKEAEIYEILPWNPLRYRFSLDEAF